MVSSITQDPYSITKSLKVASPANPKISPPPRPTSQYNLLANTVAAPLCDHALVVVVGARHEGCAAPCGDIRQETAHRHWRPAFFAVVQLEVLGANTGSDRYL